MQKTDSAKELLKARKQRLQPAVALHLRRQALDVHDDHVCIVEQPLTHRLLQTVSPGAQLRSALKHIQAGGNRLQSTAGCKNMKLQPPYNLKNKMYLQMMCFTYYLYIFWSQTMGTNSLNCLLLQFSFSILIMITI